MSFSNPRNALNAYSKMSVQTAVDGASPHRLIQMLMEGALDKISTAKGCMERGEVAAKGKQISWAISIIGGLRSSLDKDVGGDLAQNLEDLYDYMEHRLVEANLNNQPELLDEVAALLRQIKSGWDGIADQVNSQPASTDGGELRTGA